MASNPFANPAKPTKPVRATPPPNPFATAATATIAANKLSAGVDNLSLGDTAKPKPNPFGVPQRAPSVGNPFAPEPASHAAHSTETSRNAFPPQPPALSAGALPAAQVSGGPANPFGPEGHDSDFPTAPAPSIPPAPFSQLSAIQHPSSVPPPIPSFGPSSPTLSSDNPPPIPPPVPPPMPAFMPQSPVKTPPFHPPPLPAQPPASNNFGDFNFPSTTNVSASTSSGFEDFGKPAQGADPFGFPATAPPTSTFGSSPFALPAAKPQDPFALSIAKTIEVPSFALPSAPSHQPSDPFAPPPSHPTTAGLQSNALRPTGQGVSQATSITLPTPAVEEQTPLGLPSLAPQLDDDPFDLHINRPVVPPPAPAPVPAAVPPSQPRSSLPTGSKPPPSHGDPFAVLVQPLKPATTTSTASSSTATPAVPLKSLLSNTAPSPVMSSMTTVAALRSAPANPFAPSPSSLSAAPVKPAERDILLSKPQPTTSVGASTASSTPSIVAQGNDLDFLAFSKPTSSVGSTAPPPPPASAPAAFPSTTATTFQPAGSTTGFDGFGGFDHDPFAVPSFPSTTSTTAPVQEEDDFFAPPPPRPAAAAVAASKSRPSQPLLPGPGQKQASTVSTVPHQAAIVETDDYLDVFNAAPPPPPLPAAAAAGTKEKATGQLSTGFDFEDDPFGASDDPFAPSALDSETSEEKMRRLRRAYDLPSESEEEEDEGSPVQPISKVIGDGSRAASMTSAAAKTNLPAELQRSEGEIMTRLSATSLMTREWHYHYYVIDRGILYLYKSKVDAMYNQLGANCKKKIPITHQMRVLQIKAKDYKGFGTLHNFMLEDIQDFGTVNVGKFASPYHEVIQALWKKIRQIILFRRDQRARQLKNV